MYLLTVSIYITYRLNFVKSQSFIPYNGPRIDGLFLSQKLQPNNNNFKIFSIIFHSVEDEPPVSFERDKDCIDIYRLELNKSVEISISVIENSVNYPHKINNQSFETLIEDIRKYNSDLTVTNMVTIHQSIELQTLDNINPLYYLFRIPRLVPYLMEKILRCAKPIHITNEKTICHDLEFDLDGIKISSDPTKQLNKCGFEIFLSSISFGVHNLIMRERYSNNELSFTKQLKYNRNEIDEIYNCINTNFQKGKNINNSYSELLKFSNEKKISMSVQEENIPVEDLCDNYLSFLKFFESEEKNKFIKNKHTLEEVKQEEKS